jgi:hypothetical protein
MNNATGQADPSGISVSSEDLVVHSSYLKSTALKFCSSTSEAAKLVSRTLESARVELTVKDCHELRQDLFKLMRIAFLKQKGLLDEVN